MNRFDPNDPSIAQLIDSSEPPHERALRIGISEVRAAYHRIYARQRRAYRRAIFWRNLWAWGFVLLLAGVILAGVLLWER